MGQILRNWRVLAASLFSVALVVGAYMLASGAVSPRQALASTESALLQQIATKDSNGDGLPDWEKQLYGIPANATTTDYFHLGMTDGEAVAKGLIVPKAVADVPIATSTVSAAVLSDPSLGPAPAQGTLTSLFAEDFFMQYASAKQGNGGQALSSTQVNSIVQQTLSDLANAAQETPAYKSMSDLTVSGSGKAALTSFAASAEQVLVSKANAATTSEVEYLKRAIQDGDAGALTYIGQIAKTYRDMAAGLSQLPVPQELATDDLALVNAFMRLSELTNDFTQYQKDPVVTMLALQLYPQAVKDMGDALIGMHQTFANENVTLSAGQPGALFVNLIPHIAQEQAASASTTP